MLGRDLDIVAPNDYTADGAEDIATCFAHKIDTVRAAAAEKQTQQSQEAT